MIKKFIICLTCFVSLSLQSFGQSSYTLSGYVNDASTGESLLGANVYLKSTGKGTSCNLYGFYSMTLPEGEYTLVFSFLGMQSVENHISLFENMTMNVELGSMSMLTGEVVIETDQGKNTEGTEMGRVDIEVLKIKKLPAFMGEVDILKTIQFLPGVQTASEGSSGFYVRGGGPDQNLILLDNAVVYNASHLFGFFSVFNADAVKNIEIIKGGMPANYGGRLASVLNIALKEGNNKAFKVDGGIGLISSRLTIQGPIKKDVSSFIISGRRTYIDVLTKPFIKETSNFSGSGYFFYDLNMKLNYTLSEKDRIFASGYFGRDVFEFKSAQAGFSTDIPWGNATASLRWNHLFNEKLFMNTIATYSDYKFEFGAIQEDFEFRLSSGIKDWSLKSQLSYYPNLRHKVLGGVDYVFHTFTPSSVSARSGETDFNTGSVVQLFSHETAIYLLDEFDVNEVLKINAGLRMSIFSHVGPYTKYTPQGSSNVTGSNLPAVVTFFKKGEVVNTYTKLEPRINMRWKLNDHASIKGGFTQNYQYLHLTSLSASSLPTDVWVPSTDVVKPQFGRQYSVGYFRNFLKNTIETSVELYYKNMQNLGMYKEGTLPEDNVNDNIGNLLTFGRGYSYGAEFFVKKSTGDFTGWIGYTWSKTMRQFDAINEGKEFPAKFDRRHDLSVVLSYEINEKWTAGGAFVYATGNAITLPLERYFYEGNILEEFGPRNSFRMAPYHRADFSLTYTPGAIKNKKDRLTKKKISIERKFFSSWSLSVYNIYNRQNPYFIYFGNDGQLQEGNLQIKAYQVSLFPILPTITWNFRF